RYGSHYHIILCTCICPHGAPTDGRTPGTDNHHPAPAPRSRSPPGRRLRCGSPAPTGQVPSTASPSRLLAGRPDHADPAGSPDTWQVVAVGGTERVQIAVHDDLNAPLVHERERLLPARVRPFAWPGYFRACRACPWARFATNPELSPWWNKILP